jgi:hypothetical protein
LCPYNFQLRDLSTNRLDQRRTIENPEVKIMAHKLSEFSEAEWDVLLYIASHIAGLQKLPTRESVVAAGLNNTIVEDFIRRQILCELNGKLKPVPESLLFPKAFGASIKAEPHCTVPTLLSKFI